MRNIFFLVIFLSHFIIHAVPAKPGIIEFVQPDGSVVSVRLYGDERAHYYMSADCYPLIAKGDTLFFAQTDNYGEAVASGFIAANEDSRSAACDRYLKGIDREKVETSIKKQCDKVRGRYRVERARETSDFGRFPYATFPTAGSTKALVLLVAFQDIKFRQDYNPADYFWRMLNQPGFSDLGGTGSASDYFDENSFGEFTPEFDVVGPITLSRPEAFYGVNGLEVIDRNAGLMVVDACRMIDAEIDFSQYDCDDDGEIDNVFVFYAGLGEASGGSPMTIWPHSSDVKYFIDEKVILDGKLLGRYACSNEIMNNQPDGIGTFVHEFSHVMGLPDLYATSYTDAFTPGSWDVMDYGSYNNDSRTPPLMSSFERHALGWSNPAQPKSGRIQIPSMANIRNGYAYRVNDNEIYYLETRVQEGWDKYIPGEGLLIWHVNYSPSVWNSNTVNNSPDKQYVDIIEADGKKDEKTRSGDSFPGADGVRSVDCNTHNPLKTWADASGPFALSDINFDNGCIFAVFSANGVDFSLDAPELNSDCQISPYSFTIGWSDVEGAQSYEIDVKQILRDQIYEENIDFNSGEAGLARNWDIKMGFSSTDVLNPEDSSPMLMFLQTGGIITSPEFKSAISGIEFSIMALGREGRQPFVEVYVPDEDTWKLFSREILPIGETLSHFSYQFNREEEINRFRIRFGGEQGVRIYFDNLNIQYPVETLEVSIDGFPVADYEQTEITVNNLLPNSDYMISVRAMGHGNQSEVSTACVHTAEISSIEDTASAQRIRLYMDGTALNIESEIDSDVIIYSLDGRIIRRSPIHCGLNRVETGQRGVVILKIDGMAFRLVSL